MVFVPLHDHNQLKYIPFQTATVTLIVINVLVFAWQAAAGEQTTISMAMSAGIIPATLVGTAILPPDLYWLPPEATLVTYMFLHADIWHLIGNMLFLWVFGDNVEDAMGSWRFLVFYLLCGIAAGISHAYMNAGSDAPLIGASGATAGIIGAYLMLYPHIRVWILLLMRIPLRLSAWFVLLSWIVTQFVFIFAGIENETAWWAHVGGFLAGIALIVLFKRSELPFFAPRRTD